MTSVVYPRLIRGFCNPSSLKRWRLGIRGRMPEHYRRRMVKIEEGVKLGTATPVHYDAEPGLWKEGHHKDTILPVQNRPIPIIYPAEADRGLWGGEGLIKGYVQRRFRAPRAPKIWVPYLKREIIYSEILDQHLELTVTERAMLLIDDAYGLDNYILQTAEEDFHSNLALKLKQRMLETLLDKSLYPDDPVKREKVYDKYKKFLTYTRDEIAWIGLTEAEAVSKQEAIEAELTKPRPLKDIFFEIMRENEAQKHKNVAEEQAK